jgi:hypothetical protein
MKFFGSCVGVFLFAQTLFAQQDKFFISKEDLKGVWSGQVSDNSRPDGAVSYVEYNIQSVEGNRVVGTSLIKFEEDFNEFQIEGFLENGVLVITELKTIQKGGVNNWDWYLKSVTFKMEKSDTEVRLEGVWKATGNLSNPPQGTILVRKMLRA